MKDIRSAIARIMSNEVTVDMDDPELEVSIYIPKTLERTVINTLNECIRNDKRVISSKGTYSEILKKKPLFYLSRDRKFLEDLRRNYFSDNSRAGAGAFSTCLINYTDTLAAVTGITYAVKAITIKRTIDALMEDNKEILKEIEKMASSSINTFEFAEKRKIESLMGFRERIKKLSIEMLKENMAVMSFMSFITLSIQIFGKQIENKTHPIFKALQEDILDICIALGINSVPDDYMTYTKDDYSIEIKR